MFHFCHCAIACRALATYIYIYIYIYIYMYMYREREIYCLSVKLNPYDVFFFFMCVCYSYFVMMCSSLGGSRVVLWFYSVLCCCFCVLGFQGLRESPSSFITSTVYKHVVILQSLTVKWHPTKCGRMSTWLSNRSK